MGDLAAVGDVAAKAGGAAAMMGALTVASDAGALAMQPLMEWAVLGTIVVRITAE